MDIVISRIELVTGDLADEFERSLGPTGVIVKHEVRPAELMAGLEWLLPTAVAVFITQKYLGTLLQEAAKDHYPHVKAALARLIRRTTGADREVRLSYIASTPGKLPPGEPAVLSVVVQLKQGGAAKFLYEHSLPKDFVETSVESLIQLAIEHQRNAPVDELSVAAKVKNKSWEPIILRFKIESGRWEVSFPSSEKEVEQNSTGAE